VDEQNSYPGPVGLFGAPLFVTTTCFLLLIVWAKYHVTASIASRTNNIKVSLVADRQIQWI
jgi:hypothetical protein